MDLTGEGRLFYRVSADDPTMLEVDRMIHSHCQFDMEYSSRSILVATWDSVGPWRNRSSLVSKLQIITLYTIIASYIDHFFRCT